MTRLSPEAVAQMVADREAGTPGPWVYEYTRVGHTVRQPGAMDRIFGSNNAGAPEIDARRIARLPDIEAAYLTLAAENATLRASEAAAVGRVKALTEALTGCVAAIEHADMADGVCCCGDEMESHSEPMNCGHSPVDMGEYHAHQVLIAARQALTPTADKEPKT